MGIIVSFTFQRERTNKNVSRLHNRVCSNYPDSTHLLRCLHCVVQLQGKEDQRVPCIIGGRKHTIGSNRVLHQRQCTLYPLPPWKSILPRWNDRLVRSFP